MYQSTVSSSVITLLALLPVTDLEHDNIQYFQPLVKLFSSSIPWVAHISRYNFQYSARSCNEYNSKVSHDVQFTMC